MARTEGMQRVELADLDARRGHPDEVLDADIIGADGEGFGSERCLKLQVVWAVVHDVVLDKPEDGGSTYPPSRLRKGE